MTQITARPITARAITAYPLTGRQIGDTALGSTGLLFDAPLDSSLILRKGTGDPTFTRSSEATVTDWEGIIRTAVSGEARFMGARRVHNHWFATAPSGGATLTVQSGTGSDSEWLGENITDDSVNRVNFRTVSTLKLENRLWRAGVWIKAAVPEDVGKKLFLVWTRSSGGTSLGQSLHYTLTAGYVFVENTFQGSPDNLQLELRVAGSTDGGATAATQFLANKPQFEDVTGQADQTASEYVSVGVLSAPYHGAGVDGVRYFNTDRSGGALPNLMGYVSESGSTNELIRSEEISLLSPWSYVALSVNGDVTTSPSGASNADEMVEDSTSAARWTRHSFSLASTTTYTVSAFFKRGNGARNAGFRVLSSAWDVPASLNVIIDFGTGQASASASIDAFGVEEFSDGWFRLWFTHDSDADGGTNAIQLNMFDGNSLTYQGDGSSSVYAWGVMCEEGSHASTYIPTAGATVTRQADSLTYPSAGNIEDAEGRIETQASSFWNIASINRRLIALFGGGIPLFCSGSEPSTRIIGFDSVNLTSNATSSTSYYNNMVDFGSMWGTKFKVSCGDVVSLETAYSGSISGTTIQVGYRSQNAGQEWDGTIKSVEIYNKEDA